MPQRATPLVTGEHYHLYNRGHNRQDIFFERENYLFFLRRVRKYLLGEGETSKALETSEVYMTIIAYCLMPNHFHLLVRPHDDELSRRMQRLSISYTKAMNKRYNRTGALFQGQFQAMHVDRNEYLLHLSRYIHLNPVMAGLVRPTGGLGVLQLSRLHWLAPGHPTRDRRCSVTIPHARRVWSICRILPTR